MNAITADQILAALPPNTLPIDAIEARLANVDVGQILADQQGRVRWELWDRQMPINNTPAEQVLQRPDVQAADAIYTIYVDGRLVYFQPFKPGDAFTPMTSEDAATLAQQQVEQIVERMTFGKVMDLVTFDVQGRRGR